MKTNLIVLLSMIICACSGNGSSNSANGGAGGSTGHTWSEIQEIPDSQNQTILKTSLDDFGNILILLTSDHRRFSIAKFSDDSWNEPEELPVGADPGYLSDFTFTIAPNGNSMLVWSAMETYRTIHHIHAAQFNSNGGWGEIKEVESFSDVSSASIQAKYDGNNLLVVWRNEEDAGFSLWSSYYISNDNLWSTEEPVGNSGFAGEHYLQFTSNGKFVLFWRDDNNMLLSRWSDGQNWEKPIQLNLAQTTGSSIAIDLLSDSTGNLFAIWGMDQEVCSCRINNDQTIGLPDCVDVDTDGWRIKSAINRKGDIFITFIKLDENSNYSLYGIRYSPNVGWDQPQALENHTGSVMSNQIRFDDKDNAILVWDREYSQTAGSNQISIYTKKYNVLSGWEDEIQLWGSSFQRGHNAEPKIAVDSTGNAFCVWLETILEGTEPVIGRGVNIWISNLTPGGEWDQPEILKSGNFLSYPFLTMDDSGKAIICWQEQDGVFAKLYK